MGELANCPRCGTLFVKGAQDVCKDCHLEEEEKFDTVYAFIRQKKNRTATILEVSDSTGVEESLILKWVQKKRLHPASFPNLTYQCDRCDNQIYEGNLCKDCAEELKAGFTDEQPKTIAEQESEKKRNQVYYNMTEENKWKR